MPACRAVGGRRRRSSRCCWTIPVSAKCSFFCRPGGMPTQDGRRSPWLVWIAPPHEPYAPALAQQGIDLNRLLVVRPPSAMEALWAAEQALSSGVCAAVLLWLKGTDDRWLRRLKLAAEAGGALGVLFRPERHRSNPRPPPCACDDQGDRTRRISNCSRCKAAGRVPWILCP
jgi:hypothetical protein